MMGEWMDGWMNRWMNGECMDDEWMMDEWMVICIIDGWGGKRMIEGWLVGGSGGIDEWLGKGIDTWGQTIEWANV